MKIIFVLILMFVFFQLDTSAQSKVSNRRIKMIDFLKKKGEIDTTFHDDIVTCNRMINEQVIYDKDRRTISVFGIFSAHSEKYILLSYSNQLILLDAKDFLYEMNILLPFLQKTNVDSSNLIRILFQLKSTYQYNIDLNKRLMVHPPPR